MRRFVFVTLFALLILNANAIPTRRTMKLRQIDGTTITVTLVGDEFFHYHLTDDSIPVVGKGNDEGWYYAKVENGFLTPSDILVHDRVYRSSQEKSFVEHYYTRENLRKMMSKIGQIGRAGRSRKAPPPSTPCSSMTRRSPGEVIYRGQKNGLVILVNFADQSFYSDVPQRVYDRMFNEKGYSGNNHVGSVHDFFYDQSYGQFDLAFDVVGPVTVSHDYSYYGSNNMYGNDKRAYQMVMEACRLVTDKVDFTKYDWDDDGEVDQVFIVYAGYGEATGGQAMTIWPHKSCLQYYIDDPLKIQGVTINQYACSNELDGASGHIMRGIGTACHEFSHCLGLPDAYDTDYSGAFGMDGYDLMDSGGHSGPGRLGEVPYGYSAFERWYVGWMDINEIDDEETVRLMPSLDKKAIAYKIVNHNNPDEYFVLENHDAHKWYSYIGSMTAPHGLMVTHIDYDSMAWDKNLVNPTSNHQRMSIIPADNSYGDYHKSTQSYYLTDEEIQGDFFPGSKGVTRLSSLSHSEVGGLLFNNNSDNTNLMGWVIDNIVEVNGLLGFTVGRPMSAPTGICANKTDDKTVKITWDAITGASSYTVELVRVQSNFPHAFESEIYDNIDVPSFTIHNVVSDKCTVRVRSHSVYASSEWSDYIIVDVPTGAIVPVIDGDAPFTSVYDISGRKIRPMSCGIYITPRGHLYQKRIR